MAFTYDDSLTADKDKIRFNIGDTIVENGGALPKGLNFQDAELVAIITIEGRWELGVAACFERLAAAWAREAQSVSTRNGSFSRSTAAQRFLDLAQKWRDDYNVDTPTKALRSLTSYRVDGYS